VARRRAARLGAGLLAATTAVGAAPVTVAQRDDEVPQAVVTPGLVSRAALVPSRGAA
jgi:hypothetical protein